MSLSLEYKTNLTELTHGFVVNLTNVSKTNLFIETNTNFFFGYLFFEKDNNIYEAYHHVMLKADPASQKVQLEKNKLIKWQILLSELRTSDQNILSSLSGASVYARLELLAVVPENGNYIMSNAMCKSNIVKIE